MERLRKALEKVGDQSVDFIDSHGGRYCEAWRFTTLRDALIAFLEEK